jgi:hypothetical protein
VRSVHATAEIDDCYGWCTYRSHGVGFGGGEKKPGISLRDSGGYGIVQGGSSCNVQSRRGLVVPLRELVGDGDGKEGFVVVSRKQKAPPHGPLT